MNTAGSPWDIVLTVGLPMYRSARIGWLALEGLCRQEDVDFAWELIVAEEPEEAFTEERLRGYETRLASAGCVRVAYLPEPSWVPLSTKWCRIAKASSPRSDVFVLQASDCYSHPRRLANTKAVFKEREVDWFQSPVGPFLNLGTGRLVLFDHAEYPRLEDGGRKHPCALNMAARTRYVREIEDERVRVSVDRWILRSIEVVKQSPLVVRWDKSDDWRRGVDTHGLNAISRRRARQMGEFKPPFRPTDMKLDEIVPADVKARLDEVRLDAMINLLAFEQEELARLEAKHLQKQENLQGAIARRDTEIRGLLADLASVPRPWWWLRRAARAANALFRKVLRVP